MPMHVGENCPKENQQHLISVTLQQPACSNIILDSLPKCGVSPAPLRRAHKNHFTLHCRTPHCSNRNPALQNSTSLAPGTESGHQIEVFILEQQGGRGTTQETHLALFHFIDLTDEGNIPNATLRFGNVTASDRQ